MKTDIYSIDGKKKGTFELPEAIFGVKWNDSLMHQVVTSMLDNARTPVAHTKGRADVRGGGIRPWRQKGTGRARHSSIRSPIWKGGGVTHGPLKEKNYAREIPKKMRAKALYMALSKKLTDGEVLFVDTFGMKEPKTAAARQALVALSSVKGFEMLSKKRSHAALVALAEKNDVIEKSFRNIGSVKTMDVRNINPVEVLKAKFIVIENPEKSIPTVEARMKKSSSKLEARS